MYWVPHAHYSYDYNNDNFTTVCYQLQIFCFFTEWPKSQHDKSMFASFRVPQFYFYCSNSGTIIKVHTLHVYIFGHTQIAYSINPQRYTATLDVMKDLNIPS